MRLPLTALLLTAALSIAAGVAIAGLPSDPPAGDLVIVPPTSTTTTSVPATTAPPTATSTTATPTTATTTTVADAGTETSTTGPSTTTAAPTTTTTQPASEEEPGEPELVARAALDIGAANANGLGGVATATAETLRGLGYETVQPVDAVDPSPVSVVFYEPGLALEAARLAADLGWGEEATAPMADMPPLDTERRFELVALIGTDRV